MRIVRLANFVAPHSGGLRTSLTELGAGYLAAGHEPVLIIPGERDSDRQTAQGRVITLRAPRVPFTGGYRVLWRRRRLAGLLARLRPDALEVSDRTTLRWTGAWAGEHGVPAAMVSHESVTALLSLALLSLALLRLAPLRLAPLRLAPLRLALLRLAPLRITAPGLSRAVADWLNRRTATAYQQVICTTVWAAAEFERIGRDGPEARRGQRGGGDQRHAARRLRPGTDRRVDRPHRGRAAGRRRAGAHRAAARSRADVRAAGGAQ